MASPVAAGIQICTSGAGRPSWSKATRAMDSRADSDIPVAKSTTLAAWAAPRRRGLVASTARSSDFDVRRLRMAESAATTPSANVAVLARSTTVRATVVTGTPNLVVTCSGGKGVVYRCTPSLPLRPAAGRPVIVTSPTLPTRSIPCSTAADRWLRTALRPIRATAAAARSTCAPSGLPSRALAVAAPTYMPYPARTSLPRRTSVSICCGDQLRARSWAVLTTSNFPGHSSSLTALIVGLGADNPDAISLVWARCRRQAGFCVPFTTIRPRHTPTTSRFARRVPTTWWVRNRSLIVDEVEFDPVHDRAGVDRAGVRGPPSECLQILLAGQADVLGADRAERHQFDRIDLDHRRADRVPATELHLGPPPQPNRHRDVPA